MEESVTFLRFLFRLPSVPDVEEKEACIAGSYRSREPKQVMFSDGIRPGGDLTEQDAAASSAEPKPAALPARKPGRVAKKVDITEAG